MVRIAMWGAGSRSAYTNALKSSKYAGFTLLELLVVLVIGALLLGVVTPRLFAVLPGVELKTNTQQLAAILRQARSQAIAESRVVKVAYVEELSGIQVTGKKRFYTWPDSIELAFQADGLPEQQTLLIEEQPPGIQFYPDGSSSGGSAVLKTQQQAYQITVHWLTGKVSIDG